MVALTRADRMFTLRVKSVFRAWTARVVQIWLLVMSMQFSLRCCSRMEHRTVILPVPSWLSLRQMLSSSVLARMTSIRGATVFRPNPAIRMCVMLNPLSHRQAATSLLSGMPNRRHSSLYQRLEPPTRLRNLGSCVRWMDRCTSFIISPTSFASVSGSTLGASFWRALDSLNASVRVVSLMRGRHSFSVKVMYFSSLLELHHRSTNWNIPS
mmetsp:Transcript_60382/g.107650  ORF Transcript_60382/g.107650 Transcript_60382/m.107650 type:complete len:211 (-) Transcript_60382:326-958(-)